MIKTKKYILGFAVAGIVFFAITQVTQFITQQQKEFEDVVGQFHNNKFEKVDMGQNQLKPSIATVIPVDTNETIIRQKLPARSLPKEAKMAIDCFAMSKLAKRSLIAGKLDEEWFHNACVAYHVVQKTYEQPDKPLSKSK